MKPYSIGLYEKAMPSSLSLKEKLQTARDCGYDYLELSIDESDEKQQRLDWSEEEIRKLKADMEETGFPIGSLCLSGHRRYPLGSSAWEEKSMDIMKKAIELASRLGIPLIQLAGYDVYYEDGSPQTQQRFVKNLKKAAVLAGCKGVYLGFETMETPFMDTVWKSMFYVSQVGSPWLGVYPDTGNLTNAALLMHQDPVLDLESGKGHVMALHLKETVPGKYRDVPFGTGHVNFEAMIGCAWKMGVRRYVTELWAADETWLDAIRTAHDSMCSILDRQTV